MRGKSKIFFFFSNSITEYKHKTPKQNTKNKNNKGAKKGARLKENQNLEREKN